MTEAASWRWVFAGEVAIIIAILLTVRLVTDVPRPDRRPRLDLTGAVLSAAGMALVVLGVLRAPQWGLIRPKGALTIAGTEITPFGFSAVPFVVLGGFVLLALFARWTQRRERRGEDPLLRLDLLRVLQLRAGLSMLAAQQLILNGIFFILPLYLQVVLGKDALQTGVQILPISIAMLITVAVAQRLAERISPRRVVQIGLFGMLGAAVVLMASIDTELNGIGFSVGLSLFGIGVGLLASQLGNIIMSSVGSERASETGGLQGTAQNLGASLGTAMIGAVLLSGLAASAQTAIDEDPAIAGPVKQRVAEATASGIEFVPSAEVQAAAREAGVPPRQAGAITDHYEEAQLFALKEALAAAAVFVLVGFCFTRRLPNTPLTESSAEPETG